MADLFPDPTWSFAFGMASLQRRIGVFSLARYGPAFSGEVNTPARRQLTLRRALKVLAHETGHMFSLPHCTLYECLMNGSNSLDELDRNPPWLCPLCLRKLHWSVHFDVRKRYDELPAFLERNDLTDEQRWVERRIAQL